MEAITTQRYQRTSLERRARSDYFKNMEITGSKRSVRVKGGTTEPKFSLLHDFFRDVEIPRLDEIAAQIEAETGKKACIRYQMDGAGPHQDTRLKEYLELEFAQRGWILIFQPSKNSPLTNIKDACIFPALSKHVSRLQGLACSQLFQGKELWDAVGKAYNAFPLDTIALLRHCQRHCRVQRGRRLPLERREASIVTFEVLHPNL
jgi:hypothetical protein